MDTNVLWDDDIPQTEVDKFGITFNTKVDYWVKFFSEKYSEMNFDILECYQLRDYFASLAKLTKFPCHTRYNVEIKYGDNKLGLFSQTPLLLKDIDTDKGLLLIYLEDRLNYFLIDDVNKLTIKEYTTKYYSKRREHKVNWSETNNGLRYSNLCKISSISTK